jgi:hypothetical protein
VQAVEARQPVKFVPSPMPHKSLVAIAVMVSCAVEVIEMFQTKRVAQRLRL